MRRNCAKRVQPPFDGARRAYGTTAMEDIAAIRDAGLDDRFADECAIRALTLLAINRTDSPETRIAAGTAKRRSTRGNSFQILRGP